MAVSISSGMISVRSGYLATKLIAIADAFRSQSAWSCRNDGKSDITVFTHAGGLVATRSKESFMYDRLVQVMILLGARMQNENQPDSYFERFAFGPRLIAASPQADLGLVVVIPCCNEP